MSTYLGSFMVVAILFLTLMASAAGSANHVVVIVWDGMRPDFISKKHTPTLFQLARDGVNFENHHSVYCTATDVNGTALATGAYPSHSGIIANNDYLPGINSTNAVVVVKPDVVRKGDEITGGHFIMRPTVAETLRAAGKSTAIAGSKLVALIHDRHDRPDNCSDVCVFEGKSQPAAALSSLTNRYGTFPGSVAGQPNVLRDEWTRRVLTEALWSNGVPAFSLLWLSEPDASQHATGPGSQRSIAAMESSDRQLAAVLAELDRRNLRDQTDVFVVSDHGFSTVQQAIDVAAALRQAGFNAQSQFKSPPAAGDILVIGQGGSVIFFVADHQAAATDTLVKWLQQQAFSGVIFTRDALPGTFPLDAAHLNRPDPPDVVLSMRWSADKSSNGTPGLFFSDVGRQPGEGSHASLSRFDVHNTLVAAGPDLKRGFKNKMPSANTDLAPTILWLLEVNPTQPMDGRVLSEALSINAPAANKPVTQRIEATTTNGAVVWQQYLETTRVNDTTYLDDGNGRQTTQ